MLQPKLNPGETIVISIARLVHALHFRIADWITTKHLSTREDFLRYSHSRGGNQILAQYIPPLNVPSPASKFAIFRPSLYRLDRFDFDNGVRRCPIA